MAAWSGPSSCAKRRKYLSNSEERLRGASRSDALSFCPEPDTLPRLAALGILTLEEHVRHRREIRATWLRRAPEAGITARFVLHGLGARTDVLGEAAQHGDVTFLRAPAVMSCKAGALRKLMLWLQCAVAAWPQAAMIGKADDDVWVHLPGVAAHVARSLALLGWRSAAEATEPGSGLVWASFESYHWHEGVHRPVGFMGIRFAHRRLPGTGRLERCRRRLAGRLLPLPRRDVSRAWLSSLDGDAGNGMAGSGDVAGGATAANVSGPFFFPKGPLYLISRPLVAGLLSDRWVQEEAEASILSGEREADLLELTWPWEDVFIGAALARVHAGGGGSASERGSGIVGASGRRGGVGGVGKGASRGWRAEGRRRGEHALQRKAEGHPGEGVAAERPSSFAAVHIGVSGRGGVFVEEWGIKAAPATLLWHMRTKVPERLRTVDDWAGAEPA